MQSLISRTLRTDLSEESDNGEHRRTPVLELRLAVRVQPLLGALRESHGVEETERRARANHVRRRHGERRRCGLCDGCDSRADKWAARWHERRSAVSGSTPQETRKKIISVCFAKGERGQIINTGATAEPFHVRSYPVRGNRVK